LLGAVFPPPETAPAAYMALPSFGPEFVLLICGKLAIMLMFDGSDEPAGTKGYSCWWSY